MKNNTGSNAGPFQVKRSISAGKVASGRKQDSNNSNGKGLFRNKKASSARTFKCNSNDGKKAVEEHEDEIWQKAFKVEKPSKVYSLDFHGKKLEKITGIQKYPNCKSVDLSCNQIKKIENLEGNTEICELKLYSNEIKVIEGLGKLRKLQNLQLQHNQIAFIGDGLKDLKMLKVLNLATNNICDVKSQDLKICSNLVFLDLSNNNLKTFKCLNAVPYLEELYLAGNKLDECPDASCCKKLQEIDLANNDLNNLEGIKNIPSLSILNVSGNCLEGLESLGCSKFIQRLDASRNKVSSLLFISKSFPNLEVLFLADNELVLFDDMLHLQQLKDLKELYVDGNPMKVNAEANSNITWSRQVTEVLPQLEILDGHQFGNTLPRTGDRHLMRPMTPSQGLSTKTVRDQINVINHELSLYENIITSKFESMRNLLQSLPSRSLQETAHEPTAHLKQPATSTDENEESGKSPSSSLSDIDRPTSRCGSRARIKEALVFASQHFEPPEQNSDVAP